MEKIYVQITKAKHPTLWYADCIGNIYEVFKIHEQPFAWILSFVDGYYIHDGDSKVVKFNQLPKDEEVDVESNPPELEENWQEHLTEPSLLELHIMDLRATELVTSWA